MHIVPQLRGVSTACRGISSCAPQRVHNEPGRVKRSQTAEQLLRLVAGRRLDDEVREKQLLASMHQLHPAVPVPPQWSAMARNVSLHGSTYVKSLLSNRHLLVPDIEGATECKCSLTAHATTQRFRQPQLNKFLADLFQTIPLAVEESRLPGVQLSRFDLFHAHMFCTPKTNMLGMLFHSKEYPAYSKSFPINLGFCQRNSSLQYNKAAMDFRNLIWFQGKLISLDVGVSSILHNDLIMDGLQDVRTVLESDFGNAVIDVNYFASLPGPTHRKVFLC